MVKNRQRAAIIKKNYIESSSETSGEGEMIPQNSNFKVYKNKDPNCEDDLKKVSNRSITRLQYLPPPKSDKKIFTHILNNGGERNHKNLAKNS